MRPQFIGFVRAVRGERLLGNRTLVESEPDTQKAAQAWVSGMLASNVEAGKQIGEAGTRRYEPKAKKRRTRQAPVETDTDVERETAERQEAEAKSRRGHRRRSPHRSADDAPAPGKNAK